jgi:hypothetical protein
MAWGIKIPVTHADEDCTQSYRVEYKRASETQYQVLSPSPSVSPIVIGGLDACTTYNFRITRRCCNGQESVIATGSKTTGGDCLPA